MQRHRGTTDRESGTEKITEALWQKDGGRLTSSPESGMAS